MGNQAQVQGTGEQGFGDSVVFAQCLIRFLLCREADRCCGTFFWPSASRWPCCCWRCWPLSAGVISCPPGYSASIIGAPDLEHRHRADHRPVIAALAAAPLMVQGINFMRWRPDAAPESPRSSRGDASGRSDRQWSGRPRAPGRRHQLGEIVSAFRQFYLREVLIINISRP